MPEIDVVLLMIIYDMEENIIHRKSKGHWDWWLKGIMLNAETGGEWGRKNF
jgi:hypothetical protein